MDDLETMRRAIALAEEVRATTAPNPWVGAVVGVLSGAHDKALLEAAPHTSILADVTGLLDLLDGT